MTPSRGGCVGLGWYALEAVGPACANTRPCGDIFTPSDRRPDAAVE